MDTLPDEVKESLGWNPAVHHPSHYTQGGVECISAIRASMTAEEFKGNKQDER